MWAYVALVYFVGAMIRLEWMLWYGLTPKSHGLQRPWRIKEYIIRPILWPFWGYR